MYFGRALIAAVLALAATSAQAGLTHYKCEITKRPSRSFMSQKLEILYDSETGEARAIDGLIYQTYKKDIPVEVVTDNAARMTFRWDVKNPRGRSKGSEVRLPAVRETVTLLKDTMTVQIRQIPLGYDNSFTASGRCTAIPMKRQRK